jgi:hypothetical protein
MDYDDSKALSHKRLLEIGLDVRPGAEPTGKLSAYSGKYDMFQLRDVHLVDPKLARALMKYTSPNTRNFIHAQLTAHQPERVHPDQVMAAAVKQKREEVAQKAPEGDPENWFERAAEKHLKKYPQDRPVEVPELTFDEFLGRTGLAPAPVIRNPLTREWGIDRWGRMGTMWREV